jgi:hypothetical protein
MTTPTPISCLHWGSDGELAPEDYLDLPMGLIDIDPDLGQTDTISDLATCKNLPRANTRQSLDKTMNAPCQIIKKGKEVARYKPRK